MPTMRLRISVLAMLTVASCDRPSTPPDAPDAPAAQNRVSAIVTVLDADERPIGNADVSAAQGKSFATGRTDANGKVTLSLVDSTRPYLLSVDSATPYAHVVRNDWHPDDTTVRLTIETTVRGTLRDAAGQPVADAEVVADWAAFESNRYRTISEFDIPSIDGTFELHGEREKPTVELKVVGTFSKPLVTKTIRPDGHPVDFTVPLGATLTLRTPHSEGAYLLSATEQSRFRRPRDGRVRFIGLSESERYTVWIPPEHGKYGLLEGVPADGREHDVELTAGETIEGRIVWPGNDATASVDVVAVRGVLRVPQDLSGRERFRFSGLPKGVWKLTATTANTPPLTAQLETLTGSTVTLTLARH